MKILKKILKGFFILILINLIGLLVLSLNMKNIIVDGVIKEVIVDQITSKNYLNSNIQNRETTEVAEQVTSDENINKITDNEEVRKILKSKEVKELINKYLDLVIDGLIDETKEIDVVSLKEDIMNYIRNNKETLEKVSGKPITNEDINRVEEELRGENLNENFTRSLNEARKSLNKTERVALKGYKFFVSNDFRIIDIILIILDLVIIALFQKSLHEWIKTLAKAITVNGIFTVIVYIVVKVIVESLTKYHFNTTSLLVTGIIMTIYGILVQVIYKIIMKKISIKKENQNEISEVPTTE